MKLICLVRYAIYVMNVLLGKDLYVKIEVSVNKEILGYGGYPICPDKISSNSIVYSVGVGKDISFDLALIQKYNCNVFAFDPTPKSIEWVRRQHPPENFTFFPFGVANYDGKARFFPRSKNPKAVSHTLLEHACVHETKSRAFEANVRSLSTIMKMLKHDSIDLLKMDIEGAEYAVISDIARSNLRIGQICLEFHHTFPNLSVKDTLLALKTLKDMGFKLFYQDRMGGGIYGLIYLSTRNSDQYSRWKSFVSNRASDSHNLIRT